MYQFQVSHSVLSSQTVPLNVNSLAAHTGLRSSVSVVSNSEGSPSIKLGEALEEALGSEATPSIIPDNRNSDRSCDDPSSTDESRNGDTYEFQREGESDRICTDSNDNEYDYGEIELDDDENAEDCATACVEDPDEDTLEHLVGYNWNCKESLCHWQVHRVLFRISRLDSTLIVSFCFHSFSAFTRTTT